MKMLGEQLSPRQIPAITFATNLFKVLQLLCGLLLLDLYGKNLTYVHQDLLTYAWVRLWVILIVKITQPKLIV